jgi:hypothetical protein
MAFFSSNNGHYTATVKVGNKWILANNEKLEIVSAKKADEKEATTEIIFYLKAKVCDICKQFDGVINQILCREFELDV